MKPCKFKHTKYQPDLDTEWNCPKCGIDNSNGQFYIYEGVNDDGRYDVECEDLHEEDYIKCENCGWEGTGQQFVNLLIKKKNLVKCSCCKGKGYVPRDKEKQNETVKLLLIRCRDIIDMPDRFSHIDKINVIEAITFWLKEAIKEDLPKEQ